MLTSLATVFLSGIFLGELFKKFKLPALLGMLTAGILSGPYALNLLDGSLLGISADLRQFALIIILTQAGLSLDINELKKVGRPAVLMCFVPASFEIFGMMLLAPKLLGILPAEAAVMGSVVAAVSPAVVVPRMLKLIRESCGTDKSIPQIIMAGASVDDVFVIVLFSCFTSLAGGEAFSFFRLAEIPISVLLGLSAGTLLGLLLSLFFKKLHMRDSVKVIILLSATFLFVALEKAPAYKIPFSGLLAVMATGVAILCFSPELAARLSSKFSKLWVAAEIILFVLVGATVDISYAVSAGGKVVVLLALTLVFRMVGVLFCLLRTNLNIKERLFCMLAYVPKATVQAAIGGIPLAMGLDCGPIVLTVAVLSILITAPVGALGIDLTYKKLLSTEKENEPKFES